MRMTVLVRFVVEVDPEAARRIDPVGVSAAVRAVEFRDVAGYAGAVFADQDDVLDAATVMVLLGRPPADRPPAP